MRSGVYNPDGIKLYNHYTNINHTRSSINYSFGGTLILQYLKLEKKNHIKGKKIHFFVSLIRRSPYTPVSLIYNYLVCNCTIFNAYV